MKKQKTIKKDKTWKISLLIVGAVIIIIGCLVGWFLFAEEEIDFERAMRDSAIREIYIARIIEKIGKPEYIILVNYEDTPEEMELLRKEYGYIPDPDDLMRINTPEIPLDQLGKRAILVRVSIFPYAFSGEILKTEEDFISSLQHEYRHAEVIQKGKFD